MDDARERFLDAVRSMQETEAKTQKDEKPFRMVVIDLDAAIPGLSELDKGRAIYLKAKALWWIYILRLSVMDEVKQLTSISQKQPALSECHELAVQGKEILVSNGANKVEIDWVEDLIKKSEQ